MKKVYLYDQDSKEFIREILAQESPLELGNYLIPANSTEIKPQKVKDKKAVWNGQTWDYLDDFRGGIFYDKETGETKIINELGKKAKPVWTTKKPPENKIAKWNGRDWQEYPEGDKKLYNWDNQAKQWIEFFPILTGSELVNFLRSLFKTRPYKERKALVTVLNDDFTTLQDDPAITKQEFDDALVSFEQAIRTSKLLKDKEIEDTKMKILAFVSNRNFAEV